MELKKLYDAVVEAEAQVERVMATMQELLDAGDDESLQKAIEMRAELEEARASARAANEAYIALRSELEARNEAARKFVPVRDEPGAQRREMTRSEFERLNAADRMSFMLADGRLIDD